MWQTENFCSHSGQYNDGYEHAYQDRWSAEQTGANENGVEIRISRYYWGLNWAIPAQTAVFTLDGESVTTPTFPYWLSEGYYRRQTISETVTFPSAWAGREISWTIGGYSGTMLFDGYGQFEFTVRADIHAPVRVERTASPKAGAKTGILNNKAAVYTGDELTVTFSVDAGYEGGATLNGADITTGHSLTVSGSIAVITAASPKATIHLFLGTWATYMFRVCEGSDWGLYQAMIYNGSEWERYY